MFREELGTSSSYRYIPPFDDPLIWKGNSSIIHEIFEEFTARSLPPPTDIVVSVGGGGLLCGIQEGLIDVGWAGETRILAVETEGAASFAAARAAGKIVSLSKINTIASSLGALAVTSATLNDKVTTESVVVSDAQAVLGCSMFMQEYRMMVEPACGAALAVVLIDSLYSKLICSVGSARRVVVICCGGSAVNLEMMASWKTSFGV